NLVLEGLVDTQLSSPFLEQVEQALPADSGKAVATAEETAPPEVDGDVVPVVEARQNGRMGLRVRRPEVLHGLVREHDTPAERVVRPVPLVYFDTDLRQGLAQQNGRIQSGRAAAQAYDPLHSYVILPSTSGVNYYSATPLARDNS